MKETRSEGVRGIRRYASGALEGGAWRDLHWGDLMSVSRFVELGRMHAGMVEDRRLVRLLGRLRGDGVILAGNAGLEATEEFMLGCWLVGDCGSFTWEIG